MNRISRLLVTGLFATGLQQNTYAINEQELALQSLPKLETPYAAYSETNANWLPSMSNRDFSVGDVRTTSGNQAIVVDIVSSQTTTINELFDLAFETLAFNSNTLEVLDAAIDQVIQSGNASTALFDASSSFGSLGGVSIDITNLKISAVQLINFNGTTFLNANFVSTLMAEGTYSRFDPDGFTVTDLDITEGATPLSFFQNDAGLFYGANVNDSGNFGAVVDGFFVNSPMANVVNTEPGNILITDFSQSTSITGACPPCNFIENDTTSFEVLEFGGNATHGVAWATILPPFVLNTPQPQSPNGVMSYITANEITPRDQLPNTGIGTYNNLIGGGSPYHPTIGAGELNNFTATVDFATADVTALSFDGRFGAGQTFSANATGSSNIEANGTFTSPLTGACAFCASTPMNGQFVGGFVTNGNAMLGAYGLKPQNITGSVDSIVGSVLVTQ